MYLDLWDKARALRPNEDVLRENQLSILGSMDGVKVDQFITHVRRAISCNYMGR